MGNRTQHLIDIAKEARRLFIESKTNGRQIGSRQLMRFLGMTKTQERLVSEIYRNYCGSLGVIGERALGELTQQKTVELISSAFEKSKNDPNQELTLSGILEAGDEIYAREQVNWLRYLISELENLNKSKLSVKATQPKGQFVQKMQ